MDHSIIEETNQIDRYVRGTMPPAERAAFEEHFLDCSQCLEELEIARSLRESVRIAAADMASLERSPAVTEPRRTWAWRCIMAGAMAGLGALSFTRIALYRQLEHTRGELDRTELAYAREHRGATDAPGGAEPMIYTLSLSRGATAPATNVEIPQSPRWVVFSIQIEASQYPKYRAVLRNGSRQTVWEKDGFQASSPDMIAIPILSTTLAAGSYQLSLDGQDGSGRYTLMSTFPFEAKDQR